MSTNSGTPTTPTNPASEEDTVADGAPEGTTRTRVRTDEEVTQVAPDPEALTEWAELPPEPEIREPGPDEEPDDRELAAAGVGGGFRRHWKKGALAVATVAALSTAFWLNSGEDTVAVKANNASGSVVDIAKAVAKASPRDADPAKASTGNPSAAGHSASRTPAPPAPIASKPTTAPMSPAPEVDKTGTSTSINVALGELAKRITSTERRLDRHDGQIDQLGEAAVKTAKALNEMNAVVEKLGSDVSAPAVVTTVTCDTTACEPGTYDSCVTDLVDNASPWQLELYEGSADKKKQALAASAAETCRNSYPDTAPTAAPGS